MKLLEYQAHELFTRYGIPAAVGTVIRNRKELKAAAPDFKFPAVIKAQVQTGGRGKAGGVKIAETQEELISLGGSIFDLVIKKLPVRKLFITGKAKVRRELYLSITLDRKAKVPVLIFCAEGGIEINEIADTHPDKIVKIFIDPLQGIREHMASYIIEKSGLDKGLRKELVSILTGLYALFVEYDCLLAEINPLIIDADGRLQALDGKLDIDDNALMRHEDIEAIRDELTENLFVAEARKWGFLYIPISENGNIGIVSNGSGMIMSCIDLIIQRGETVSCALDLGGGATADRVREAIRIVFSNPAVELVFVNIFGGITRCDEIATGIETAVNGDPGNSIVVRMEGTNKELGVGIIRGIEGDVELVEGLIHGVERIHGRMQE
jgi:succinyl-CoA synthetase beta subunit